MALSYCFHLTGVATSSREPAGGGALPLLPVQSDAVRANWPLIGREEEGREPDTWRAGDPAGSAQEGAWKVLRREGEGVGRRRMQEGRQGRKNMQNHVD